MDNRNWKLLHAIGCLGCAIVTFRSASDFDGTEYLGGQISGPIFTFQSYGVILFAAALVLTFYYCRTAAFVSLIASAMCLPFYLFNVLPISFLNALLPYPNGVVDETGTFRLNGWSIAGLLFLTIIVGNSCWLLFRSVSTGAGK